MNEKDFEDQLKLDLKKIADEVPNVKSIKLDREQLFKRKTSLTVSALRVAAIFFVACGLGLFIGIELEKQNHISNSSHSIHTISEIKKMSPQLEEGIKPKVEYIIEKKGDLILIEGFPPMRKVHQWNVSSKEHYDEIMRGNTEPFRPVERVRYEKQEIY